MNKILKTVLCFFEGMGRARAAAELGRMGRYEAARALMEQKCQHC